MRHLVGPCLTIGLLIGAAAESEAQFSLNIGNPYYGSGIGIGSPAYSYGYGNGYANYKVPVYSGYSSGYSTYSNSAYVAGPGALTYSSGYRGYAPTAGYYGYAQPSNPYGYTSRPYYGAYGYGLPSGNGFRPFRAMGRPFR